MHQLFTRCNSWVNVVLLLSEIHSVTWLEILLNSFNRLMKQSTRLTSWLLIILQFLMIGWLIIGFSENRFSFIAIVLITLAFVLIIWAVVAMRKSYLSVFPEPTKASALITNGPYRFIRHPMYTAVIIGCAGLLYHNFTWIRLFVFIALVVVLLIKLNWEEKMLIEKFPSYIGYMKHTKKLLPGIL